MFRLWVLVLVVGLVVIGCGETSAPVAETPESAAPESSVAPASEPQSLASIFPPGEARDMLMNTCGSCHNVACSAIGQRTAGQWAALREGHTERVSKYDLDVIFPYLQSNFGPDHPEPDVPAQFLEGGCTPF